MHSLNAAFWRTFIKQDLFQFNVLAAVIIFIDAKGGEIGVTNLLKEP